MPNIDLTLIATYGAGLILLLIVAKLFLMPFRILLKLIGNAILGGALLWTINLIGSTLGFTIAINWASVLIVALLGIPGVALLIIWKLFF